MAIIQAADIADLLTAGLAELGEQRWTDVSYTLQEHVAFSRLMRRGRVAFASGHSVQWDVQTTDSGAARNTGLFEVDNVDVVDTLTQASVPWRHYTTNWAMDMREISMNTGRRQIIDLALTREHASMISLAGLMETDFWTLPSGPTDNSKPFGVDYWIQYDGTEGFNGGNPPNFNDTAGIDRSSVTAWRNYTRTYATVTLNDLVREMRNAATFTMFRNPDPQPDFNRGDDLGYFCNYTVLGPLEEIAESRNDNLGTDIARMDGRTTFRGVPITWVPQLEGKTGNPVYGINFGVFQPTFLTGWEMRRSRIEPAPNQHTVVNVHIDNTLNYVCRNPRRNFIIATEDPTP